MTMTNREVHCDLCSTVALIDYESTWFWVLDDQADYCPKCVEVLREAGTLMSQNNEEAKTGEWKWIESTETLQIDYFNNDLRSMTGADRDRHVMANFTAAVNELNEMLDEHPSWKPWSSEIDVHNHEAFRDEIVDVLHFVANLVLLGKISEDELWDAYRAKQQRNRDRMSSEGGYQASKNKCPRCKRELDKPGAYQRKSQRYHQDGDRHSMSHVLLCNGCTQQFELVLDVNTPLPGATRNGF